MRQKRTGSGVRISDSADKDVPNFQAFLSRIRNSRTRRQLSADFADLLLKLFELLDLLRNTVLDIFER